MAGMTGKRKMGRPPSNRDDATAKIDRRVILKAKYVASAEGITLAELLTEILRPVIDRRHAAHGRDSETQ